jgi:hypothetical protein
VNTCDETTTPPDTETSCDNGVDDDGDGLIDGDDPDCQSPEGPEAGNCSDGIDNDGDGFIDGDDPDCQSPDTETSCDNGVDDDGDGSSTATTPTASRRRRASAWRPAVTQGCSRRTRSDRRCTTVG